MLQTLPTPDDTFRALLRQHRLDADLTQCQLGLHAGVDPSLISRLERGLRPPPGRDVTHRLAAALGLARRDEDRLLVLAGHAPLWLMGLARVGRIAPREAAG